MYECPNCSNNLKFSIEHQAMFCDACGTTMSPYQVHGKSAEENEVFQVQVFTCPQFGGEIVADTNEAMSFCMYCGASTLLESRLETLQRPAKIIPFKKTKKECTELYKTAIKKSWFSQKEQRNTTEIDSFRGIYMPYWSYKAQSNGNISFEAEDKVSKRKGDYVYTKVYDVHGTINVEYDGCVHDAASTFPDRLSEGISPYNLSEAVSFHPAFMSGFYGDAGDVNSSIYEDEATEILRQDIADTLGRAPALKHCKVEKKKVLPAIPLNVSDRELIMLPVWFMSLRTKLQDGTERITYSVVNGQTGALVCESPVSMGKVYAGSAVIAAVIFLLGCLITYNFMPSTICVITGILLLITVISKASQNKRIYELETGVTDQGASFIKNQTPGKGNSNSGIKKASNKAAVIMLIVYAAILVMFFLADPHNDLWYYGLSVAGLLMIILLRVGMISKLNNLATRPLPQFKRKGGDDSAKR